MRAHRILFLLLMTAALMSCQIANMGYNSGSAMSNSGSNNVPNMSGIAFHPGTITISSGATITWTNYDYVAHTVTATSGPAAFADSGPIAASASYSLVLTLPGTYTYKCSIHASMTGTIVVQ